MTPASAAPALELAVPASLAGIGPFDLLAAGLSQADLDLVLELFEDAAPGARVAEVFREDAGAYPGPRPLVVVASLDQARLAALRARAALGLRTLVHPIPYAYPWAFWDFYRIARAGGHRLAGLASFQAMADQVAACPYMREYSLGLRPGSLADLEAWPCYRSAPERAEALAPGPIQTLSGRLAGDLSREAYRLGTSETPWELWNHFRRAAFERPDYMSYLHFEPGSVVLNLGVFTGHELPCFFTAMQGEGRILNVDPLGDDGLHPYVRSWVKAFPEVFSEVRLAASDRRGFLNFGRYPDGQFYETGGGAETVPCISLDALVEEHGLDRVDVVKIDVEGGEPKVLEGARALLARHRPQLAVSIYHTPGHLHELPNWLLEHLPGYDLHVDHHSYVRYESVCYAIPRD